MIDWETPRRIDETTTVHLAKDRSVVIRQQPSVLRGELDTFVVSFASNPEKVHGTLSSLEEAKAYAETHG